MFTVDNAEELGKPVCLNLNGEAATISVAPRPTIFASAVWSLGSNRRGGDYGYEYGRKPSINNDFNGLTCVSWKYTAVTHELLQYMP